MKKYKLIIFMAFAVICISAVGSVSAADAPSANFTSNVTNGSAPLSVQFNDTSTGNPTSWYWNFGDGSNSTEQNPVHNYTTPGRYNVSLAAGNENGNNTLSMINYISAYSLSDENGFTNPGFETGDLTGWTSGSDTNMGGPGNSGQHSVHFSGGGDTTTNFVQQKIDMTGVNSISFWGYEEGGYYCSFDVYIDGNCIGSFGATPNVWIEYIIPMNYTGIHTVKVAWDKPWYAGFGGDIDDFSTNLSNTLATDTSANFTSTPTNGSSPLTVQFNDSSFGLITNWLWNFGDGTTSTEKNPTHIYNTSGVYNVTFTVTGPYSSSTKTVDNLIVVNVPVVNFTSNVTDGGVPLSVQFNDTSIGNPTSWYWNFGDGTHSTEQNPVHVYKTPGRYAVTLIASNVFGNNTISKADYILAYLDKQAGNVFNNSGFETGDFTGWTTGYNTFIGNQNYHSGQNSASFSYYGDQSANYVQQDINLTNVGNISFWGYGDGNGSQWCSFYVYIDGNCVQSFNAVANTWTEYTIPNLNYTGIHTIQVTWDGGWSYGSDVDDFSTESSTTANFTATPTNGRLPLTVQFNDTSIGKITNWLWNFGDGNNSTDQNPTHIYTQPGNYTVTLTITGLDHNSTETIDNLITIVPPTNTRTGVTYDSIQDAVDDAQDGDTIIVGSGTYPETYTENVNINKRVTIIAQGNVTVTALNTNDPVFTILSGGNNSVINGFIITGATGSSGIYIYPSVNLTIINDTITDNEIGVNVTGNATITNDTIAGNNVGVNVTGNATITNDTIAGNNVGVNVTGNATATNDTITGNNTGVDVENGISSIHFNNIYGNALYGLKFTGNGVDASNNWWGTNNPTHASGTTAPGKLDIYEAQNGNDAVYDPWIVLNATSNDNLLKEGDNSTITVDMTHNSQNNDTSGSGSIPDLPANFYYGLGTLSTTNTTVSRGRASTVLTGGSNSGTDGLIITVGNYTTDIPITVDTTAPTVNVTLASGTYNTTQTVKLTTTDPDSSSITYYTTDATDPRTSSTRIQYTVPIVINQTTTLRYAAVDPAGNWSLLYLQNYVIGTGGLANSSSPEYQINGNHTGQSSYNGPSTNTTKWTYDNITVYGSAVIGSDGTIYIGGYDGKLYAFNPNGILKWTYTTASYIVCSPAVGSDGTIYVSDWMNSTLYAIDPNGIWKWTYNMGDYSGDSSPVIGADGTIYIPTTNDVNGTLYAFNSNGTVKWTYTMGPIYGSSAAIGSDGTIYIADCNSVLYAINPDGSLKWSTTLSLETWAASNACYDSPSIGANGTIYIPIYDSFWGGCLYAVSDNGTNGTVKWTYNTGNFQNENSESLYGAPAISSNGTIYAVGASNLYALDPNGNLLWTYNTGGTVDVVTSVAIGHDGTIYVGGSNGLFALKPDGSLKWNYTTGSIVSSPVIGSDGTLYIGTTNGTLYAFNDIAANFIANTTNISDPLNVQFTDKSTGTPKSWKWNFGDGKSSSLQNPAHTYSKAGDYTVTLTVTMTNGTVLLRTKVITVKSDLTLPTVTSTPNGGTAQTVTLKGVDNSGSATVYYTTDGTDPRISGTRTQYTEPITIDTATTILYAAIDPSGNWSPVYNGTYTKLEPVTNVTVYINNASTYTGSSLSDQIQSILDNAAPGSTIDFLGTEYDNLQLTIDKQLNIISNAGTKIVTSNPSAVFLINGLQASGTNISGFIIINTGSGSGILINNTSNVTISNDQVSSTGGSAVLVNGGSNVTVNYSSLTNSITGINISGSKDTTVNKSTITGNSGRGVGIYNSSNITVDSSSITNNASDASTNDEAGVYVNGSDHVKIINDRIDYNFEGVSANDVSNFLLNNSTMNNEIGDGIYLFGSAENLTVTNNTIDTACNGIRLAYGSGGNVTIRGNLITNIGYGDGQHVPDFDPHSNRAQDAFAFAGDFTGDLITSLYIGHNVMYHDAYYGDGHDANLLGDSQINSNVYGSEWSGDDPFYANAGFCCKIHTRSSNLEWVCIKPGVYEAYFVDGDTNTTITDIPDLSVAVTVGGQTYYGTMHDGKFTFTGPFGAASITVSVADRSKSTSVISKMNGTHKTIYNPDESGSNPGSSGNSGNNAGGGSGNGAGSATAGVGGGSGGSGSGSASSIGSAATAVTGSISPSQSSSAPSGGHAQELFIDNTAKNSQIWGIIGIIVLVILIFGIYYRKDLMNMIKRSK